MTQEYKLPPLPDWADSTLQGEDRDSLFTWASAALEADRKRRGEPVGIVKRPSESHYPGVQWIGDVRDGEHLYASPQPAAPNEWKLAVDRELTNIHSTADSFPSAKEAVEALIDWNVAVATDPKVNGQQGRGEPVAWRKRDGQWWPLYEGDPQPAEPVKQETMTARELADRVARGEKWKIAEPVKVPSDDFEDAIDAVSKAMSRAWQLGQTYWQQADSESYTQNKKSYATQDKYNALVDETRALLARYGSKS